MSEAAPCSYCGTVYDSDTKRYFNTGLIPVVLDESFKEWGERAWDMQMMAACSCSVGAILAARDKNPITTFDRATSIQLLTGWQSKRISYSDRKHWLVFGGPDAARKFEVDNDGKSFAEIMEGIR
jgi:hypothetical protein